MIWRNFRTVLYCVTLRWASTSKTSRTVAGPVSQRTAKISSSESVGLGGLDGGIYENITSNVFVCQARLHLRTFLLAFTVLLRRSYMLSQGISLNESRTPEQTVPTLTK